MVAHTGNGKDSENWDLGTEHIDQVPEVVTFLLKAPVVFKGVTRCCMTGEERMDTALTHEMAMTMKAR